MYMYVGGYHVLFQNLFIKIWNVFNFYERVVFQPLWASIDDKRFYWLTIQNGPY